MDLSFAKDSDRFSTAVEQLRKEGIALTAENIKARYEKLDGKEKKEEAPKEEVVAETTDTPDVSTEEEAPKKSAKRK